MLLYLPPKGRSIQSQTTLFVRMAIYFISACAKGIAQNIINALTTGDNTSEDNIYIYIDITSLLFLGFSQIRNFSLSFSV